MSTIRPISLVFKGKVPIPVSTSASSAAVIAKNVRDPIQVRLHNRDTVDVAYCFGKSDVAADITKDPVLSPGGIEIITVEAHPDESGTIYASVQGDAGASKTFDITPCRGI